MLETISENSSVKYDVVIIGGGAAGLMCAIEAGKKGRSVIVLEHEDKIGKKILISGGGRCNFTNKYSSYENFISDNPHFCKSALSGYTADDFIQLVEEYGIAYHEKKLGQLFCDGSSRQIVSLLENECSKYGVKVITGCSVKNVQQNEKFEIETTKEHYSSGSLVISTGGISIPKMGATDLGYRIAKKFGLKLTEIRPALVPLIFNDDDKKTFHSLSGISIDSMVNCYGINFRENILFTHKGLSGPAILQISSYRKEGQKIKIDLLPEKDLHKILTGNSKSKIELVNFISTLLPRRFTEIFCGKYFQNKSLNQYSQKDLKNISEKFHNWEIYPAGTEGFSKAEVTLGGVSTDELSSKTMESKKVKGLYFIGEVVDVTGWLGGYNFQWAWSSGYAAGKNL